MSLFGIDTLLGSVLDIMTPGSEPTQYDDNSSSGSSGGSSNSEPEYSIWGTPLNESAKAEQYDKDHGNDSKSSWW